MAKSLLILGGGGHASVLVDILKEQGRVILGVVAPVIESEHLCNLRHYTKDEDVFLFKPSDVILVNGIGSMPRESLRRDIYYKFTELGYLFETVIASSAIVSSMATFEQGVQILQGAIIQVGVNVMANTIINSGAILEHDCHIGMNNHIAPGAKLSGGVKTANNVHLGTGSSVIQKIKIGEYVIVGAGAVVCENVHEKTICFPARTSYKELKI